jgi:hypothetical protein
LLFPRSVLPTEHVDNIRDMQKKLRISKKSSNFAGVFENRL